MTRPRWHWAAGWLGLAALLATLVFYAASGLLAPAWAVALLLVVWLALLALAIWLMRRGRPLWVLLIPVAAWLIWFGALTAGETWLGWTG
jgi:FtsH-binding integral membrane protein